LSAREGSRTPLRARERHADVATRSLSFAVIASSLLVTAAALLGLEFRQHGLAVVWPAAGIVTGLFLLTPEHQRWPVTGAIAVGLFCGNLLGGRPLSINLMFVVANLAEAWLIALLASRWIGAPVQLQTLRQVSRFVAAVAITVSAGGAVGAAIMNYLPEIGTDYLGNWNAWVRSRGIGMLTVAPAVVALGSMRRQALQRAWRDGTSTFAALIGIVVSSYVMVSADWVRNDLLALLLLLALVYPLVLFVAARSEPAWTHLSLLLLTLVVVWRIGHGGGIFHGSVGVAQAFLFVSSLWALTLGVVMEQQRRTRELAQASECSMREALAAGRGFTFDWDPRTDRVTRVDPHHILAPFASESGAAFFERLLPADRNRLRQLIAHLSPTNPMYETTFGVCHPDGRIVWLQERGVGEFDETGGLCRLQGLTMDVTDRREAEEALLEADRKKDRFIATLAHELRNPLAPIRTAAELLRAAGAGPAEIAWSREVIERQVDHMAALLDDLLDVARITLGKLEVRKQWVSLDAIVEAAVEVARPLIDTRAIRLAIDLPVPAPQLEADPLRLGQVISNLLTNAAKYADAGGLITLAARVHDDSVDIIVRDDGIGIPREALGSIFAMFSQVESATERSHGGLGIGLALVKGLVERHGGTVSAHSDGPGTGSEFVVTLPCITPAPARAAATEEHPPTAHTSGRHILVVDDNRDAADSLALLLGLEGHEVRVAYAGRAALQTANEFTPDVAVLDLGLPDMSGYEVARQLRQNPALTGITLIALTGWGQQEHRRRALDAGFDHHVTKPVDIVQLGRLLGGGSPRTG